jgi:hypothetical protein
MVDVAVAGYTGIIEQGLEQQQGAKPMTTKQNPNVSMLDEDLDQVSGGLVVIVAVASFTSPRGDADINCGLHNNGAFLPLQAGTLTRLAPGRDYVI